MLLILPASLRQTYAETLPLVLCKAAWKLAGTWQHSQTADYQKWEECITCSPNKHTSLFDKGWAAFSLHVSGVFKTGMRETSGWPSVTVCLRSVFFFLIQTGLCLTASCLRCLPSPYSNSAAFNTKVTKGQRCSLLFCQWLWVVGSSSSAVEFTVFLQHVFPSSPTHKALTDNA